MLKLINTTIARFFALTSVLNCIVRFVKEKNYIFEYNIAFRKYKNVRISIHLRCLNYTLRNKVNYSKKSKLSSIVLLFLGVLSPIQFISSHCYTCCVMLSIAAGWYDRYVEFFNNTLPNNQTLLDMWKNHLKLWEENVSLSSTVESLYFVGGSIFVEFVRTSYQGINTLIKLTNQSINILIHKNLISFCK